MEETDSGGDDLFSMEDIKVEVMRARGAGGQVSDLHIHLPPG
jgi:peptide chain release factor 1